MPSLPGYASHPPADADLTEALAFLYGLDVQPPEIVLVLGSGLGDVADSIEAPVHVRGEDIPGYPRSTVQGHSGRLVFGWMAGRRVVFVQGRVHFYEGISMREVTFPIRLLHAFGGQRLLVTNAAGGINTFFPPGALMFISDHLNLAFPGAVRTDREDGPAGLVHVEAVTPYDGAWLEEAEKVALGLGIGIRRGVYAWTRGPSYETPAEIRMYRLLGADAVGMSTVPEVLCAAGRGMPVLGISTITNAAAGLGAAALSHGEVLEVGRQVRDQLVTLIYGILQNN